MPIDKRVDFAGALEGVEDGATVFISGFGGAGFPNRLIRALRERGPKGLTLVVNSATHRYSLTHELIEADLVRKVICTAARGHSKDPSPFETRWMAGKIELEMVPQGTFTERIRAGGAGIPAFFTRTGAGTDIAKGKEEREFDGERYIMERGIVADLSIVHAWKGDTEGNLVYRKTARNFNPMMATAGKMTIAEVENLVQPGEINPDHIITPGVFVKRMIHVPDAKKHIEQRTVRKRSA
jgi:3-oxoacid CoA-transferase A subunit